MSLKKHSCIALVMLFFLSSCASTQRWIVVSAPNAPLNKQDTLEVKAGREIHESILRNLDTHEDNEVSRYVNNIALKLVPYAGRKNIDYTFTVLRDERIYAKAAPGGYVYVTTGMLEFVESEAQLAGVLSHEIARAQFRDPQLTEAKEFFDDLLQTSAFVAPQFPPYGVLAVMLLSVVNEQMFPVIDKETKVITADCMGMSYMASAEYDPQSYLTFLNNIIECDRSDLKRMIHYLTSHPITTERITVVHNYFQNMDLRGKTLYVGAQQYMGVIPRSEVN